jgi:hypothetical protein
MGKFALRAAEKDLRYAELPENVWRDAGMISLGYFRILELEINARFIIPMVEHVDISFIEDELAKLNAISTKNGKRIYEFWKRISPQIRGARTKKKGLDLGALELLFRKLQDIAGDDINIKRHIYSSLAPRLSNCGLEALSSGELADLINENVRETYRNPPAHTRYVDLRTAQASKSYVQEALGKLLAFTAQTENLSTKIH